MTLLRQIVAALLLVAACGPALIAAESTAGVDGLLLLNNGNLIAGKIVRVGDDYRIERHGLERRVPANQVEAFCRTADEAYQLRKRRSRDDSFGHADLARWCLRNDLPELAARELLDARAIDPTLRDLPSLERQLTWALRKKQRMHADGAVVAAAHQTTIPPTAATPNLATNRPSATGLSASAKAQFARSIQPMLIHNCATAGCHQPGGAPPLQLERMALEGGGSRAAAERNLASVLALLSSESPDASRLLAAANAPHGPGSPQSPALSPRQSQLLVAWIYDAVGYVPPQQEIPTVESELPSEAAIEEFGSTLPPVAPSAATSPQATSAPGRTPTAAAAAPQIGMTTAPIHAIAAAPNALNSATDAPSLDEATLPRPSPAMKPSPSMTKSRRKPLDPFDPAEFQRRIDQRQATVEAEAASQSEVAPIDAAPPADPAASPDEGVTSPASRP